MLTDLQPQLEAVLKHQMIEVLWLGYSHWLELFPCIHSKPMPSPGDTGFVWSVRLYTGFVALVILVL